MLFWCGSSHVGDVCRPLVPATVWFCAVLSACELFSPDIGPANITGVVYAVDDTLPADDHPSRIWLTSLTFPSWPPDSAGIIVWSGTDLLARRSDGWEVPADFTSIGTGDTVDVWHTNTEYRSRPPQYNATRVVLRR